MTAIPPLNSFEEALSIGQKLAPESYVSLFTALYIHGINYQLPDQIDYISTITKIYNINQKIYNFRRIKPDILCNLLGLEQKNGYMLASPERAICDTIYLYPQSGFDYLGKINKDRLYDIAKDYASKSLLKKIEKLCQP
ncbi:MAG: hypothetical protein H7230_01605 [Candidatus Parcubacteria bacterium]|nr:hypothetical protein [Candidatus Paceibacterota bacterium]